MKIYQGSIKQFMKLWSYSNSKTYNYFVSGIKNNIIEFWTIELNDELIAELYIFWDSVDKEEANNFNRAYLCAFRVNKNHQGKGLGSLLMRRVLKRIKEKGFTEVTIGIDNSEHDKLAKMYNNFGFTEFLKETHIDNHQLDSLGNPIKYNEAYKIMKAVIK